jgi:putative FmdB family regulatory protein
MVIREPEFIEFTGNFYEYQCQDCHKRSIIEVGKALSCPHCQSDKLERVPTACGLDPNGCMYRYYSVCRSSGADYHCG